jgi:hypothetical protein
MRARALIGLTRVIRDGRFTGPPLVESHLASGGSHRFLRSTNRDHGCAAPIPFTVSLIYDMREPKIRLIWKGKD